ncbi:excinuclease ABC subunit UvrA [bacterium]|nr:excinuclease ABC subunit UvrA [bacterium]
MSKQRMGPTDRKFPRIELRGVETHNLKSFDVSIPLERITVVTGVSGSGKSSLAFDTLFAEGQRRYVETFSAYSRQFLPPYEKPAVERIDKIPPAIAVSQHRVTGRVSLAAASGLLDYLRAAFARSDQIVCPVCQLPVASGLPDAVMDELLMEAGGSSVTIQFEPTESGSTPWSDQWTKWREEGFLRVEVDGQIARTDQPPPSPPAEAASVRIVLDRIKVDPTQRGRFVESLETAYRFGDGKAECRWGQKVRRCFEQPACSTCGMAFPIPESALFSFAHLASACPTCQGQGEVVSIDRAKVLPNKKLSLDQGAIAFFQKPSAKELLGPFLRAARQANIDTLLPIEGFSSSELARLFDGEPSSGFEGIAGILQRARRRPHRHRSDRQAHRPNVSPWWAPYQRLQTCPSCQGAKLRPEVLAYQLAGLSIASFLRQSVGNARQTIEEEIARSMTRERWYQEILHDVKSRLVYLDDVGLGYLELDRAARTLSGGESRRVSLATALGSRLAKTLFVLDEPTAGLHPRDLDRLWETVLALRHRGNTVVLVEHETEWMRRGDWLIDLGPGAGRQGGELLFQGPPEELDPATLSTPTALFLRSKVVPKSDVRSPSGAIQLRGASLHHLQEVDVDFPLGVLLGVAGVSGSGKSSLMVDTLHAALAERDATEPPHPGAYQSIAGYQKIDEVVLVDDHSLGRTSRGNAATYLGFFDGIRELFASTADAKVRGFSKGDFSFNRPGGRCETCEGLGYLKFDMQFLPEARVTCSACLGRRFESRIGDIKYRGLSVDEVLHTTADEAFRFFRGELSIQQRLKVLKDVGLGYLPIGQSLDTLSGGERQRLRLASFVTGRPQKRCLFILEEPTTGLHPADIEPLVETLSSLVDVGHSVMVIEHDLRFLTAVDFLIELGPGSGPAGGRIIAQGTPAQIAQQSTATGLSMAEAMT